MIDKDAAQKAKLSHTWFPGEKLNSFTLFFHVPGEPMVLHGVTIQKVWSSGLLLRVKPESPESFLNWALARRVARLVNQKTPWRADI